MALGIENPHHVVLGLGPDVAPQHAEEEAMEANNMGDGCHIVATHRKRESKPTEGGEEQSSMAVVGIPRVGYTRHG